MPPTPSASKNARPGLYANRLWSPQMIAGESGMAAFEEGRVRIKADAEEALVAPARL
jgi:hypothetical protein